MGIAQLSRNKAMYEGKVNMFAAHNTSRVVKALHIVNNEHIRVQCIARPNFAIN